MKKGQTIFLQLMNYFPIKALMNYVEKYRGNNKIISYLYLDYFYNMAFAQLTYLESLQYIEACRKSKYKKLYHMGSLSVIAKIYHLERE